VNVFYGSSSGLSPTSGDQWFYPGHLRDRRTAQSFDYFGYALAAVDFDDDLIDDLAIGAPGEEVVHVLYGTSGTGLTATGDEYIDAFSDSSGGGSGPGTLSWFGVR
jgi:hypothetical protein